MEVKLIVLEGRCKQREIPLPPTMFVIGRSPKSHLRPHNAAVSKQHCAIARWKGKVLVRDLKSVNGTFVNGERVHGEVAVQDGDTLQVGTLRFRFQITADVDDPLPGRALQEGEVRWLMDQPTEGAVLAPSVTTKVLPAFGNGLLHDTLVPPKATDTVFDQPATPAPSPEESAVSAGEYLHDYFRGRK